MDAPHNAQIIVRAKSSKRPHAGRLELLARSPVLGLPALCYLARVDTVQPASDSRLINGGAVHLVQNRQRALHEDLLVDPLSIFGLSKHVNGS